MKIGNASVQSVSDGTATLPIEQVASHPDGEQWNCDQHPVDANGRIRLDTGGFLVHLNGRIVLVDAGGGPKSFELEMTETGNLLSNLRQLGVEPSDVTDVAFTHLHWDHIGWSSQRDEVVFPNATFYAHEADWNYFTSDSATPTLEYSQRILAPISDRIEFFTEETEILPGLLARPAPGHTPGSTAFVVHDAGERAMILGDIVHTVAELTDPIWEGAWDVDATAARAIRERLADELLATQVPFAGAHFPDLPFGRLVERDGLRKVAWLGEK